MAVNPMMQAARVNGMSSAIKGLNRVAQEVAEFNRDRTPAPVDAPAAPNPADAGAYDRAEALTSLKLYQRQAQAAAEVVATADGVLGFLLDVHA